MAARRTSFIHSHTPVRYHDVGALKEILASHLHEDSAKLCIVQPLPGHGLTSEKSLVPS